MLIETEQAIYERIAGAECPYNPQRLNRHWVVKLRGFDRVYGEDTCGVLLAALLDKATREENDDKK